MAERLYGAPPLEDDAVRRCLLLAGARVAAGRAWADRLSVGRRAREAAASAAAASLPRNEITVRVPGR